MQIKTIAATAADVVVAPAAAPAPQSTAAAGTAAAERAASVLRVYRLLSSGSRGVRMSAAEARG